MLFAKNKKQQNRKQLLELAARIEERMLVTEKRENAIDQDCLTPSLIQDFLFVDAIKLDKFIANYKYVSSNGQASKLGVVTAVLEFSSFLKRPQGYPLWFIAGYPDLVATFADYSDASMEHMLLTLYGTFSESIFEQIMEDSNGEVYFKWSTLRRFINFYKVTHSPDLDCV